MKIINEFKEFAVRGSVVDLAVGVIIGGAFGKIVSSLVNDIIMPPVSTLLGAVDFKNLRWTLTRAPEGTAAITLNYGSFLQTTFEFLLIALSVFFFVKGINTLRRKLALQPKSAAAPAPSPQEKLLMEIRDALKEKK